ncbi:unnamed protein product [Brassica napus]|uniref:(rape) hypothetical protein n=1 Tax=Brassica napus TaxID=3708 RepID=A0A816RA16_BRANA|nr:unnamed protein product [Brassica napus]
MDCYAGMKFEELVVPNYQESSSSEVYRSNGMWGGWSMNSSEAVETGFNYDPFNGEGSLYSQMSIRSSEEEDEESKRSKAFYGASSLHDFEGIEQMDDIGMMEMFIVLPAAITVSSLPLCMVAGMFTCSFVMTCL